MRKLPASLLSLRSNNVRGVAASTTLVSDPHEHVEGQLDDVLQDSLRALQDLSANTAAWAQTAEQRYGSPNDEPRKRDDE